MNKIVTSKPYRKLVIFVNTHFPVLMAKMRYRKILGRSLNLKNPKDLNEKIHWLSLFSDTSDWTRCADKYAVREFVAERGADDTLVKLYGKWDKVEDIDWEALPKSFVLKTTNGSGTVMVVKNKAELNIPETKALLQKWLKRYELYVCKLHIIIIFRRIIKLDKFKCYKYESYVLQLLEIIIIRWII